MNAINNETKAMLASIGQGVAAGQIIPFLGPGVLEMGDAACPVPTSPRELCGRLTSKVGVPGRIRHNLWSSAQYIESNRHRRTLETLLNEAFGPIPTPGPIHTWLASLETCPLIVDTWYDGTMAAALQASGRTAWGQVQGVTRNGEWRDIWYKFFHGMTGNEAEAWEAGDWLTMLYKPHGSVVPAKNYLLSDSDYVEVLTEIDIQTPIPNLVKDMRTTRGFVFLGCRFYDQMLRTYARQISKRSAGPFYVLLDPDADLTRNEERFLTDYNVTVLRVTLDEAAPVLSGQSGE